MLGISLVSEVGDSQPRGSEMSFSDIPLFVSLFVHLFVEEMCWSKCECVYMVRSTLYVFSAAQNRCVRCTHAGLDRCVRSIDRYTENERACEARCLAQEI